MNESVLLDIDARGIARVTLNRPDKHNAFNEHVIGSMHGAFKQVQATKNVRALVLAAEGKSFSAGADLDWMQRMAHYDFADNVADAQALAAMLHALNTLPFPTIARVQGAAFGGGVGLVACCDLTVATNRTKFCLSEVKLGLIPATVGPYVVAAMGERAARRYFTTAEVISADQAQRHGLVSDVVDEGDLDQRIDALLEQLSANSPDAMAAAKQLVFDVTNRPIDEQLMRHTSEAIAKARCSAQGREGVRAFLEKRKPSWYEN